MSDSDALAAPGCHRKSLTVRAELPADPDAARDVTVFATTDHVDRDDEVVMPSGADLANFERNPVLLLSHSIGQPGAYGLPIGKVVGLTRRPRGILAGLSFSRDTDLGRDVKALFASGMLNAVSIGFLSLESSLMTREEAESRPDWKEAFDRTKGRIVCHRRWELLELSVVAVPANPQALVTSYKAKGLAVPAWLQLPEARTMSTENTKCPDNTPECKDMADGDGPEGGYAVGDHVKHKGGKCGEVKSVHKSGTHRLGMEDDDEGREVEASEQKPVYRLAMHDAECKCYGPHMKCFGSEMKPHAAEKSMSPDAESEEAEEDMDADGDFDGDDEAKGFKRGDHVKIKAPHYKGVGVVHGVYKRGHVPDVEEDLRATDDEPAARVRAYRKMGDGHEPTDDFVGAHVKHLSHLPEDLHPPTKPKQAPAPKRKEASLPPLVALPEPDPTLAINTALSKLNTLLRPETIRAEVAAELDRRGGVI